VAQALAGLLRTLTALLVVALAAGLTAVVVQGGPQALLELAQQQLGRLLALADRGTTASAQAADEQQQAAAPRQPVPPEPPPLYHPEEQAPAPGDSSAASAPGPLVPVKPASFARRSLSPAEKSPGSPRPGTDWDALQHQLGRLGVVRWQLESLPGEPPQVRFRCEVPHPVRPGWVQFFQAQAPSPAEAIARVLAALRRRYESQVTASR